MDIKFNSAQLQPSPSPSPSPAPRAMAKEVVQELSVTQAASVEAEAPTKERVQTAVLAMQEFAQSVRRDVQFSLDEGSGRVVVKVTDASSGSIIRQMPSEEALELAERLDEVRSLLFQAKA